MASRAPWAARFGLARTPFGKAIAAGDLFARQAHAQATARISFCIAESALGVVTGDVGAGKTVAVRAAVAALDPTRHQVIYIANPAFGTRGLYVTIVRALGAQPRYLKAELMAQAADLLAAETAERHRTVVLIVDEAHLLQPDQLEELRLMTKAEMDSASPFAGILIGQPTLARQLRMGTFAALDQRIGADACGQARVTVAKLVHDALDGLAGPHRRAGDDERAPPGGQGDAAGDRLGGIVAKRHPLSGEVGPRGSAHGTGSVLLGTQRPVKTGLRFSR